MAKRNPDEPVKVKVETDDASASPQDPAASPVESEELPTAAAADEPGADVPGAATASDATVAELARCQEQLDALRQELLYERAELENFKRRTQKRHADALRFASEDLLRDLLPVLDNLERAASHAGEAEAEGLDSLVEGIKHVIAQFHEALGKHGVESVAGDGAKFDPEIHDAMVQVPGAAPGLVASVYEPGYTYRGRLLRPAKVAVTKVAPANTDD